MTRLALSAALGAALLAGAAPPASAQGNSGSGSGLSPYASESGNDRSAGVNNGNNILPRYQRRSQESSFYESRFYESRFYEGRVYERPVRERGARRRADPYYGYPY